jgi:hypothetical protein
VQGDIVVAETHKPGAVSSETEQAEQEDQRQTARADRPPTQDEERAAETQKLDPKVAEAYEKAAERGANVKGEGQIEP